MTHLNSAWSQSGLRREEVGAVAGFMRGKAQHGHPPILNGDFDAPPDADEIRCLDGMAPLPVRGFVLLHGVRMDASTLGRVSEIRKR